MSELLFLAVTSMCVAITGTMLWLNSRRLLNQSIALSSAIAAISFLFSYMAARTGSRGEISPDPALLSWLRLSAASSIYVAWSVWLMAVVITTEPRSLLKAALRSWPQFAAASLLAILCMTNYYIPEHSTPEIPLRGKAYTVVQIGMGVFFAATLWHTSRGLKNLVGVKRIEAQFFLINSSTACLVMLLLNVASAKLGLPGLRQLGVGVIGIMFLLMVWALNYHRIFDARDIFISLGQRLGMLLFFATASLGLAEAFEQLFDHALSHVLAVCLSGAGFFATDQWLRRRLNLDAEKKLELPRAQIIAISKRWLDPEKLRTKLEFFLRELYQSQSAKIVLSRETKRAQGSQEQPKPELEICGTQGWVTQEHLQRLRPSRTTTEALKIMHRQSVAAIIAVPRGSTEPSLQLTLGPKLSLRPYTYPEILVLINLTELIDNLLINARLSIEAAKIERMESMTMMSRSLAHDLNNLTTPVSAYLVHMENKVPPGTVESEVYSAARHSIGVMQDYIRESLFFARKLSPEFKPFTVSEIFIAAIPLAQKRATKRQVSLETSVPNLIPMNGDPVLIQRLLANLINNAIEASSPGDTVHISASLHRGTQVAITVADRGCGVQPENIRRIFEPYFTTKDTGDDVRGIGLGLAICQKIADLHGGEIEVKNLSPKGTAFTVILPLRPESPGPNPATT